MYSHYPNHVILRSSEGNISYNPVLYPGRFITQEIVDLKYPNSEPPSDQVFLGNSSFIKLKPDWIDQACFDEEIMKSQVVWWNYQNENNTAEHITVLSFVLNNSEDADRFAKKDSNRA